MGIFYSQVAIEGEAPGIGHGILLFDMLEAK